MEREAFYQSVEQRADLSGQADARDATRAVLSTAGERLSEDQSHDLSAQLPDQLADHLTDGASGRRFSYEEFLTRVEQRAERVDVGDPERISRAVFETLLDAVDESERAAVVNQFEHYGWEDLLANADHETNVGDSSPREQ